MTKTAPLRALALLALTLAAAGPLHALTFAPLEQARRIAIGGNLEIRNFDGSVVDTAALSRARQAPHDDPFGSFDMSVGLSALALSTPLGDANGAGRAAQRSILGADSIEFEGFADVFMSGSAGGDAFATGSGHASSQFDYHFDLAAPQQVRLTMRSTVAPAASDFQFVLEHDDGELVWDSEIIGDENGDPVTSFSKVLDLRAGSYWVRGTLTASSYFDSSVSIAGRAEAAFSLTAVPEPAGALLMLGGLAVLPLAVARRRRYAARVTTAG